MTAYSEQLQLFAFSFCDSRNVLQFFRKEKLCWRGMSTLTRAERHTFAFRHMESYVKVSASEKARNLALESDKRLSTSIGKMSSGYMSSDEMQ